MDKKATIKSVALKGNGAKGLTCKMVRYTEGINDKAKMTAPKESTETMKVAVGHDLMASFRKLRYYLLESTERIQEPWKASKIFKNGDIDQDFKTVGQENKEIFVEASSLFDRTFVDKVELIPMDGAMAYKIYGRIENKDGFMSVTVSPMITDEHSTLFYTELSDIVGSICELTLNFLFGNNDILKNAIEQLKDSSAEFEELDEEEQIRRAIKMLESKGCVVVPTDEDMARIASESDSVRIGEELVGNIAEKEEEENSGNGEFELKKTVYDHTASDDNFSDFEDISESEGIAADSEEGFE